MHTQGNTDQLDGKKDKTDVEMEPRELRENKKSHFWQISIFFSEEKNKHTKKTGFKSTVIKRVPAFKLLGNEEWVMMKIRLHVALLPYPPRSKTSGQANNELQNTLLFPFWVTICYAKSTLKQILSLSMKLFSQLLDNITLPASCFSTWNCLQLFAADQNIFQHTLPGKADGIHPIPFY